MRITDTELPAAFATKMNLELGSTATARGSLPVAIVATILPFLAHNTVKVLSPGFTAKTSRSSWDKAIGLEVVGWSNTAAVAEGSPAVVPSNAPPNASVAVAADQNDEKR